MSFSKRLYVLLLSILVAMLVVILLVSPQTISAWTASLSEIPVLLRAAAALVVDLGLLALLYFQVRPEPGAKVNGLMMRASGAITEVSVDSARERILKAVSEVPDIVSVDAQVKPIRGRADVELQVTVLGHDVRLPAKQKEINRALNQVIDKQLGLRLAGQPRVHVRFHGEEISKPYVPLQPELVKKVEPLEPVVLPVEKSGYDKELVINRDEPVVVDRGLKPAVFPIDAEPKIITPLPEVEKPKVVEMTPPLKDELALDLEDELAASDIDDIVDDDDDLPAIKTDLLEKYKPLDVSNHHEDSSKSS